MELKSLHLKGFKSINVEEGAKLDFEDITILLGANGVGKSNLVSFFNMLSYIVKGAVQNYVAENGFADSLLFFGSKQTRQLTALLNFEENGEAIEYLISLSHAANDSLICQEDLRRVYSTRKVELVFLKQGGRESDLVALESEKENSNRGKIISETLNLLRGCQVFHFHDTSQQAKIRGQVYVEDNFHLSTDASNLAAFLFKLKENPAYLPYYQKIVRYIKKVMPQFGDFVLRPNSVNNRYITLNWYDKSKPFFLFGPHQISDGSLRFMALATLLLQPKDFQPKVIILDEPELGLHPSAIGYLAGMIKAASKHAQIVIATQSQRLVDEFDLENIVIAERNPQTNSTIFSRKNPDDLANWLEEYSLSELWEKNVIGGQP